jgi:uncharacterized protein YceK
MKKIVVLLLIVPLLSGCARLKSGLNAIAYGSGHQEIEQAYQNKEITKAEYLQLKQQEKLNNTLEGLKR